LHWTPRFGGSLQTAIVLFSFRSITRSRQHRVVLAFYLSIVFAIALVTARDELSTRALRPLSPELLIPTIVMMALAVVGMRNVFPLPISLNANWVLRLTQLNPSHKYHRSNQALPTLVRRAPGLAGRGFPIPLVQALESGGGTPRSPCSSWLDFR